MSYKSKTKKNKKIFYKKKKRFYTKRIGGSYDEQKKVQKKYEQKDNVQKEDQTDDEQKDYEQKNDVQKNDVQKNDVEKDDDKNAIDNIKKDIEEEKKRFSDENSILAKSEDIALNVAANTVDKVGDLLGVDLTDPNLIKKNKEEIQQISKNAAEMGNLVAESIEPFAKPLIDKSINASGKILSKVGATGVKVMLNTAAAIPGIGVVVGTMRSLGNIGDAIVSTANTGSQLVTSTSDSINASVKNFDRLIKEKEEILNRTKASIDEFSGGTRSHKLKKKVGTYKIYKKNKR